MAVEIIDLSNYRDRFGSRVEEGEYKVQVEDIEIGKTQKGDPMWTVYLRIVGSSEDGKTLVDRLTITEKALFRMVGFLEGMGIKTGRKRLKVDTARLVGRYAIVTVSDGEPYNGTIRSEVRSYSVAASAASQEVDLDDVEVAEVEEAAPTPSAEPASETVDDADLDLEDIDI